MQERIAKYLKHLEEATRLGEEIGKAICDALKPVIPDLKCKVGTYIGDVDVIYFSSEKYGWSWDKHRKWDKVLEWLIVEVFPELEGHVDSSVFLMSEEVEKVRELLFKFKKSVNAIRRIDE